MDKTQLKKRLIFLRYKQNLTTEEVAKKIGLSPSAIRNYESGLRIPSIKNIEKLAKIYQCNPAYILGWIK